MKYILLYSMMILGIGLNGQQRSSTHDLGNFSTDVGGDVIIKDNYMYSFSAGYKVDSVVDNRTYIDDVTEVFKMDLETRTIIDTLLLQSTNTKYANDIVLSTVLIKNALLEVGDGLVLFSDHPDDWHGIQVHQLSSDLSVTEHKILTVADDLHYFPQSICRLDNFYYVGGATYSPAQSYAFVMKISDDFELLHTWRWQHGDRDNWSEGWDLQVNPSNNLSYIAIHHGIGVGNTDGTNLVEIDTNGNILLDSILTDRTSIDSPNLHINLDGDYVFNHRIKYPRPEFYSIDYVTKQEKWYLLLPYFIPETQEFFSHRVNVLDYANCTNGDILATGVVMDVVNGISQTGFVIRMTADGELVFFKRIVLPPDITINTTQHDYKYASFSRVEELPTGEILLHGMAGRFRDSIAIEFDHVDLWVLTLDADGCYNGDCGRKQGDTEILLIDTQKRLTQPDWGIGTKWYYEYESIFPPEVGAVMYEIIDTTTFRGEHVYILNTPEGETFLKQSDGRVWIYIPEMDNYQLTYDFNLTHATTFLWDAMCPDSIDGASTHTGPMMVDTIVDYTLPDGELTTLQTISYAESTPVDTYGTFMRRAIKNIGFDSGGLGLSTGYLTCDNVLSRYTQLRCFEHGRELLNFVGYSCDSTFVIVNTEEVVDDADITIYPNPSSGVVRVDTKSQDVIAYRVYTLDGRMISAGTTSDQLINIDTDPAMYILHLQLDGVWVQQQVIIR